MVGECIKITSYAFLPTYRYHLNIVCLSHRAYCTVPETKPIRFARGLCGKAHSVQDCEDRGPGSLSG